MPAVMFEAKQCYAKKAIVPLCLSKDPNNCEVDTEDTTAQFKEFMTLQIMSNVVTTSWSQCTTEYTPKYQTRS